MISEIYLGGILVYSSLFFSPFHQLADYNLNSNQMSIGIFLTIKSYKFELFLLV